MKRTLGQRIRELRQQKRMSLRDLGEVLKDPETNTPVSAAFLSDIENSRRFPSDEMLEKIAKALGTDVADLNSHDQRAAARELGELVEMNVQYAFAFRQVLDEVKEKGMSPEQIVEAVRAHQRNQKQ
ncbi:helix-turn-helix domain-containing protein [Haloferula sp. A504]|uniref:helix-turn-helix domain-containing protein n=1 Tax=Haloferula sp. A504 TaxID=3373601 RepID=UPI0031BD8BF2|nr:helix-turn-helix domain-containing protein [Verrucomicrobiaceae bacterium E54]